MLPGIEDALHEWHLLWRCSLQSVTKQRTWILMSVSVWVLSHPSTVTHREQNDRCPCTIFSTLICCHTALTSQAHVVFPPLQAPYLSPYILVLFISCENSLPLWQLLYVLWAWCVCVRVRACTYLFSFAFLIFSNRALNIQLIFDPYRLTETFFKIWSKKVGKGAFNKVTHLGYMNYLYISVDVCTDVVWVPNK